MIFYRQFNDWCDGVMLESAVDTYRTVEYFRKGTYEDVGCVAD